MAEAQNSYAISPDYVHLRVHSAYSLSEGAIPVKDVIKLCQQNKMPAVALTDTNNLFGSLEFSGAASGAAMASTAPAPTPPSTALAARGVRRRVTAA